MQRYYCLTKEFVGIILKLNKEKWGHLLSNNSKVVVVPKTKSKENFPVKGFYG